MIFIPSGQAPSKKMRRSLRKNVIAAIEMGMRRMVLHLDGEYKLTGPVEVHKVRNARRLARIAARPVNFKPTVIVSAASRKFRIFRKQTLWQRFVNWISAKQTLWQRFVNWISAPFHKHVSTRKFTDHQASNMKVLTRLNAADSVTRRPRANRNFA